MTVPDFAAQTNGIHVIQATYFLLGGWSTGMVTPFRALVALALIFHAVGLFAIPQMPFLFSPDAKELMKYGGHGATLRRRVQLT